MIALARTRPRVALAATAASDGGAGGGVSCEAEGSGGVHGWLALALEEEVKEAKLQRKCATTNSINVGGGIRVAATGPQTAGPGIISHSELSTHHWARAVSMHPRGGQSSGLPAAEPNEDYTRYEAFF